MSILGFGWGSEMQGVKVSMQKEIARALVEQDRIAEARGIERAAKAVEPKTPRPCDCERCYCGNVGDLERIADWDARANHAAAIRKLMGQDNG